MFSFTCIIIAVCLFCLQARDSSVALTLHELFVLLSFVFVGSFWQEISWFCFCQSATVMGERLGSEVEHFHMTLLDPTDVCPLNPLALDHVFTDPSVAVSLRAVIRGTEDMTFGCFYGKLVQLFDTVCVVVSSDNLPIDCNRHEDTIRTNTVVTSNVSWRDLQHAMDTPLQTACSKYKGLWSDSSVRYRSATHSLSTFGFLQRPATHGTCLPVPPSELVGIIEMEETMCSMYLLLASVTELRSRGQPRLEGAVLCVLADLMHCKEKRFSKHGQKTIHKC